MLPLPQPLSTQHPHLSPHPQGAPESILSRCTSALANNGEGVVPLTEAARAALGAAVQRYGGRALRTLALAYKQLPNGTQQVGVAGCGVGVARAGQRCSLVCLERSDAYPDISCSCPTFMRAPQPKHCSRSHYLSPSTESGLHFLGLVTMHQQLSLIHTPRTYYKHFHAFPQLSPSDESGLTFLGLVAMHDPPRPECLAALHMCKQVGQGIWSG